MTEVSPICTFSHIQDPGLNMRLKHLPETSLVREQMRGCSLHCLETGGDQERLNSKARAEMILKRDSKCNPCCPFLFFAKWQARKVIICSSVALLFKTFMQKGRLNNQATEIRSPHPYESSHSSSISFQSTSFAFSVPKTRYKSFIGTADALSSSEITLVLCSLLIRCPVNLSAGLRTQT